MTPTVFNNWYSDVHVQAMVDNNFATVALRYSNYTSTGPSGPPPAQPPNFPLSTNYLALYDVPDVNFFFNPETAAKLTLTSDTFPNPTDIIFAWSAWVFTFWLLMQVYEGKLPAPPTRPKYVLVEKIEPAAGGDANLDNWYRTEVRYAFLASQQEYKYCHGYTNDPPQHLPLMSILPTYRRSTRYTSSDGPKPRFLALHEVDDINLFMTACLVVKIEVIVLPARRKQPAVQILALCTNIIWIRQCLLIGFSPYQSIANHLPGFPGSILSRKEILP
jgi:hypothetical protein